MSSLILFALGFVVGKLVTPSKIKIVWVAIKHLFKG